MASIHSSPSEISEPHSLGKKSNNVVIYQEDAHSEESDQLKRGLKDRHISLLALAGIIGPGILIGASMALKNGPAAMVIGFGVIGIIAFAMMQSLGELSTLYPSGGAFSTLGAKFVDPAWGGAVGWYYCIIWIAVLSNEYNTTAAILQYWGPQVPIYGYVLIFWATFMLFQFLGVGVFGEAEYWLALFKILGLVAFYIFAIVYCAGGVKGTPAFGFHYWNDPGSFNNGFKGVASTFVFASTFYSGTESIAIAAGESRNPSKAVPTAIRQTFWRIVVVYMGVAISYGLTVPYDDPSLNAKNKTLQSPMSIALQRAGWEGGVHLINAFILITCISAINSSIYIGSRTIVNLAMEHNAPRFLAKVNRHGVPYMAVILMNSFGLLSLMNVSTGAAKAYNYIVNISGVAVFIVWGNVSFYQIRFRMALKRQGREDEQLPYRGLWYPVLPWISIILNVFLALVQGWMYFVPFSAADFVDAYILLPVFFVFYFGLKLIRRTKWVTLDQVNLDQGRRVDLDAHDDEESTEKRGFRKYLKESFS
ncbi:general amino acid permease Agp3p [Diutina catenulata]